MNPEGDYVLYWMVAFRRTHYNFALDQAVERARSLKKPLLILEALRAGYEWASDRLHTFVVQGMAAQAERLADRPGVHYFPYLEPKPGDGRGLLAALAERAAVVVTDDFPSFFLPRMQAAAGERLSVRLETVDSNGILPIRAPSSFFLRAHDFRRYLQRNLPDHFADRPARDPLARFKIDASIQLPPKITRRWPAVKPKALADPAKLIADMPIDHAVAAVDMEGGAPEARRRMKLFLEERLSAYGDGRNHPDQTTASGLSPWLHFGHLSVHEVFQAVIDKEKWSPDAVAPKASGSREGWWGMSTGAESFFDELITWREVGFNMTSKRDDYAEYESLPEWARKTLEEHAADPREHVYDLETLEGARTHDEIWNAAQTELVRTGRMHNYLRMLWGKKILEWSPQPRDALQVMIELNNKYALDGRNPNSYSGIFWVLGRYDRAWGPERP
ncbi:MAG: deoxyribodipyrimidine photolyase, partial [Myxococcota bacterium]